MAVEVAAEVKAAVTREVTAALDAAFERRQEAPGSSCQRPSSSKGFIHGDSSLVAIRSARPCSGCECHLGEGHVSFGS
jgi:hypothetical protein